MAEEEIVRVGELPCARDAASERGSAMRTDVSRVAPLPQHHHAERRPPAPDADQGDDPRTRDRERSTEGTLARELRQRIADEDRDQCGVAAEQQEVRKAAPKREFAESRVAGQTERAAGRGDSQNVGGQQQQYRRAMFDVCGTDERANRGDEAREPRKRAWRALRKRCRHLAGACGNLTAEYTDMRALKKSCAMLPDSGIRWTQKSPPWRGFALNGLAGASLQRRNEGR